jgi:hypothetical protein
MVWSIFDFSVVVANAGTMPAMVTITGPMGTSQQQTVSPNSLAKFYLPWVSDLKGPDTDNCGTALPLASSVLSRAGAYHLVSTAPVTVYQFNALEYQGQGGPPGKDWSACPGLTPCADPTSLNFGATVGCFSFTNDSSLLLPSTAMTGNYRVTAFPGESMKDGSGTSQPAMNSYVAITAITNGTHVTVSLSPSGTILSGTGIPASAGGAFALTLDAGDVAELVAAPGDGVDLSGSLINADQPIQVIAGAPCDQIPESAPACDHLEQSVFPAETLGKRYVVTAPTGPSGVPVGRRVRFYGNTDGTTLMYSPALPEGCPATLNAGQVVDCGLSTSDYVVTGDFEVTGSHEFAVGSFMLGGSIVDPGGGLGDPSQSLVVAVEQYRSKYVFLAPEDYELNYADVVTPMGASVVLDGIAIDQAGWRPIGDGYGVLRVPLAGVNPRGLGAHVLMASAPFGLQVLGYGEYTSYQYPGGLNLMQIAAAPMPR